MHEVQMRIDRMRELLHKMVNVQELKQSKELVNSIEDDAKRAAINSTKLRAAAQNVDYPAFAALVSCSHLKPMTRKELDSRERKDKSQGQSMPAWSFDPAGAHTSIPDASTFPPRQSRCHSANKFASPNTTEPRQSPLSFFRNPLFESDEIVTPTQTDQKLAKPQLSLDFVNTACERTSADNPTGPRAQGKSTSDCTHAGTNDSKVASQAAAENLSKQQVTYTSDSFLKEWRRLGAKDFRNRLLFLSEFSPSSFPELFRVEIPPFLLGEILDTLLASLPPRPGNSAETGRQSTASATKSSKGGSKDVDDVCKLPSEDATEDVVDMNLENRKCDDTLATDVEEVFVQWVVWMMEALKKCGRFELAVNLMGKNGRRIAAVILDYVDQTLSRTCIDSTFAACEKDSLSETTTDRILMECVTTLRDVYCKGMYVGRSSVV